MPKLYFLVRETGLEPAWSHPHTDLNRARLPIPPFPRKLVDGDGFEPSKSVTADLQSAPFGRSGTHPRQASVIFGAGDGTRTRNLLITNQLLCQLSYTSKKTDIFLVPWGGIEPPTYGFSVHRSTDWATKAFLF